MASLCLKLGWLHFGQSLPEARMATLWPVSAWSLDGYTMASLCLELGLATP